MADDDVKKGTVKALVGEPLLRASGEEREGLAASVGVPTALSNLAELP